MQRDADIIRQEQIEKMAKDFCGVPCVAKKGRTHCDKLCEIYIFAHRVYDAGFRKADDVRKETAKEILQLLYSYPHEYHEKKIIEIAKEYGVEVKE